MDFRLGKKMPGIYGYRSLKFVRRIVVTNEFQDDGTIAAGWSWYAGI
jgi:hypothetical protein